MIELRYTRSLFLRGFCVVYLTAFLSFYIQKPGLYGDKGVLPAKSALENSKYKTFSDKLHYQPTLLWLTPYLGLDTNYALDVLALLGAFLAFTGFVSQDFCTLGTFAALWSLYFSLFQVGQVFVTSGFDELLLEAGFIAIIAAPLIPGSYFTKSASKDLITFWLLRWLLFRFLLTNGLTKLLSGSPSWWSLTALSHHFEVTPLPSPLSWYVHHLPQWLLKLSQVFTNVCEMGLPFLFFVPIRSVRVTGFFFQLFLQICIALTGNFGFSNILLVILQLSLLDDQFFYRKKDLKSWVVARSLTSKITNVAIHAVVLYFVIQLYSLNLNKGQIESNIAFTKSQFDNVVSRALTYTTYFGLVSLATTVLTAFYDALFGRGRDKVVSSVSVIVFAFIAAGFFSASTVPLTSLHPTANSTVHPSVRSLYTKIHKLHLVNQYEPLSKMPVTTGRSEIIFEGATEVDGPWQEINFLFKPGNVNSTPPFCAPHSPRLDWQISRAAYSTYDKEQWLISFAHRILSHEPEVLSLIDFRDYAFRQSAPKYLRAVLYKYQYTPWSKRNQNAWWTRQKTSEYMPALSKDSDFIIEYLKARNLLPTPSKDKVNPLWKQVLDTVRYVINHLEATLLYWSVLTAGFAIICTATSSNHRVSASHHHRPSSKNFK